MSGGGVDIGLTCVEKFFNGRLNEFYVSVEGVLGIILDLWTSFYTFEENKFNFFHFFSDFRSFLQRKWSFWLIYTVNPEIHPKNGNLAKFKIFFCYDHCTLVVYALFLISSWVSGEELCVLITIDVVFVSLIQSLEALSFRILHYHMGSSHISAGGGWHRVDTGLTCQKGDFLYQKQSL